MTVNFLKCLIWLFLTGCQSSGHHFPGNFLFGVATSAYQIEGGWKSGGKGPNIWDKFTHDHPDIIKDSSNGNVACNSYNKIEDDINILKELGVQFYRFSLSWSRLLPSGYSNDVSQDGIRYYNELINNLTNNSIEPIITLYHWDLPMKLQEIGGWPNPFLAHYFADYARLAFEQFADRVKIWITFNEPYEICTSGYGTGYLAPGINSDGIANYLCSYTVLMAHAEVYHIFDDIFRPIHQGVLGISANTFWYEPKNNTLEDKEASELSLQLTFGWWMHPLFSKTGDFPHAMKEHIRNRSKSEIFRHSRLPELSEKEIKFIKGTSDFLGLNHYSTFLVSNEKTDKKELFQTKDFDFILETDPDWEETPTPWIKIVPWGLRKILNWIKNEYNNPVVYITESGMGDDGKIINDEQRYQYIKQYLEAVLLAIYEDGCNVTRYTVWSLMDNFEWINGYILKFGLYHVNFNSPRRKRSPKASAAYYKKVIRTKCPNHKYKPMIKERSEL